MEEDIYIYMFIFSLMGGGVMDCQPPLETVKDEERGNTIQGWRRDKDQLEAPSFGCELNFLYKSQPSKFRIVF